MRVRVLYFGVLKERFGAAEEPVQLAEGATVGELVRELQARTSNPAMGKELASTGPVGAMIDRAAADYLMWRSLAVAVNREYAPVDTVLREGDEVALLPPVSGGLLRAGRIARSARRGCAISRGASDARDGD